MRRRVILLSSAVVVAATTGWAMFAEVSTFGRPAPAVAKYVQTAPIQTGLDFSNNTWRAVRGLVSGENIYGPPHSVIPGIGPAWPVSQHLPASLLWQAPFAALPLAGALFTFAFASIAAIWAAVFLLTRPRTPPAVFLTACCGAFAIVTGGGQWTLLDGQPTAFILLGLAVIVRVRRPWLAGLGFMLAASTIQTGLPLALALLLMGSWHIVWRGAVLAFACSLPPVIMEISNAGFFTFLSSFLSGSAAHLGRLSNRIDVGALLGRAGVANSAVQIGAGILVAALALAFIVWVPAHLRRLDYPPVLCLVVAFTLLCVYHQPYDMLLVSGAIIPIILVRSRSAAMLAVSGLAAISACLASYVVSDTIALVGVGLISAFAALHAVEAQRAAIRIPQGSGPVAAKVQLSSDLTVTGVQVGPPAPQGGCRVQVSADKQQLRNDRDIAPEGRQQA